MHYQIILAGIGLLLTLISGVYGIIVLVAKKDKAIQKAILATVLASTSLSLVELLA
jgi:hypothetical protein